MAKRKRQFWQTPNEWTWGNDSPVWLNPCRHIYFIYRVLDNGDPLYQDWVNYAFADFPSIDRLLARGSKTVVIRKNAIREDLYLDAAGRWGDYRRAKRFRSQDRAEQFAHSHDIHTFGLFD